MQEAQTISVQASPSLALIKYWGKQETTEKNIPATTSVAITLDTLISTVKIVANNVSQQHTNADHRSITQKGMEVGTLPSSSFTLDDIPHDFSLITPIQQALFDLCQVTSDQQLQSLSVCANNNFPTASGLASSASGYAALAHALAQYYKCELTLTQLSSIARVGSGSACRSVYEGFTLWEAGSPHAILLAPQSHWQDFRVIVLAPSLKKKAISSRDAMKHTAKTSPYYSRWCSYNEDLSRDAIHAVLDKDIEKLGTLARLSYSAMHASSIAANPPILYWKSESISLIELSGEMRAKGIPVWETMDAGPQVKLITLAPHVDFIIEQVSQVLPDIWFRVCMAGQGSIVL